MAEGPPLTPRQAIHPAATVCVQGELRHTRVRAHTHTHTHTHTHCTLMSTSVSYQADWWVWVQILFVKKCPHDVQERKTDSDCKYISEGKIGSRSTKLSSSGTERVSSIIYLNVNGGPVPQILPPLQPNRLLAIF